MPPAPCHDVLTVTDEPGPAGATVQLVTIDELASFSMTVCPATSTVGLHVAHPRLGGLQLPLGDGACALPALEHLVVAVVRGQDLRAHRLVIRDGGQHRRPVSASIKTRAGRADLSHQETPVTC